MTLPTTTELLLQWDAQRPRSQQQAMGMSKLGSCRRQAGYHLQGYPADPEFEPEGIQNVMGTAIHEVAAQAAMMFIPGAVAENIEVSFGGLMGHPDLVVGGVVRDIKTVSYAMMLQQRRELGPPLRERYQVHCYAAGLVLAGYPVHTVEIDYIDRGSGEEYLFSEPFDGSVVEDAMSWLAEVRSAEITLLPRDYRPDSAFCQHCPWFRQCWDAEPGRDPLSVLYRDDPDAAAWAAKLEDARKRKKQAEDDEKDAKGALDALRSISRPGEKEWIKVPGMEREIRFSVAKGKQSFDGAQIAVDYKNAGARPPMKRGDPIVSVALVKPRKEQQ